MKFGIQNLIPVEAPLEDWKRFVRMVDEAGFEILAVGDIQTRTVECFVHLTMTALHTSRVRFGPYISNPTTRHPAVVASAYASLQRVSNGRAFLGIGTGGSALGNLGLPTARLTDLEEHVEVFRALIKDGTAMYRGKRCNLPWAPSVVPQGVPVYVAANGPKSLRLAGGIADGIIVGGGITKDVVEQSMAYIEEGARAAGRKSDDIDIWFLCEMNIANSYNEAVEQAKTILVGRAHRNFRFTLEGKAVPKQLESAIRAMEREYQAREHMTGGNARLLDKYDLTEFVAERWLIGGTADAVIQRLRQIESYGVKQVHIPAAVPDPLQLVARIRDEIMPQMVSDVPHL